MDDNFIDKMADAVQRHLRMSFAIDVQDAHIALERVPFDLMHDDFCTVWEEYNGALFDSIRLLVRYERSLKAWDTLAQDLEDDVRLTCIADYAYPTFRVACDLPLTFKEQLAKGVVKLEYLATGDRSLLEKEGKGKTEPRAGYYYGEVKRLVCENPELKPIQDCLNEDLYDSVEAKHLQEMHGRAFHDSAATLMSGRITIVTFNGGGYGSIVEDPIDLKAELEILDRHRARIQQGYELFSKRARNLYEGLRG